MRFYLKKEFNLLQGNRLSHIWHMTASQLKKPIYITDGALNVLPRVEIKLQILKNAVEFYNKVNSNKPNVAILSGTEDPIESMPSSVDAKKVMELSKEENINAFIHGPLAFDNAVSKKAAEIKNIEKDYEKNLNQGFDSLIDLTYKIDTNQVSSIKERTQNSIEKLSILIQRQTTSKYVYPSYALIGKSLSLIHISEPT